MVLHFAQSTFDWERAVTNPDDFGPVFDLLDGEVGDTAARKMVNGNAPVSQFQYYSPDRIPDSDISGATYEDTNFLASEFRVESGLSGGGEVMQGILADVFMTMPGVTLRDAFGESTSIGTPPDRNPFPMVLECSISDEQVRAGDPLSIELIHQVPTNDPPTPLVLWAAVGDEQMYATRESVDSPRSTFEVRPTNGGEQPVSVRGVLLGSHNPIPCPEVRWYDQTLAGGVLPQYAIDGEITFASLQSAFTDFESGQLSQIGFGVVLAASNNDCSPDGETAARQL